MKLYPFSAHKHAHDIELVLNRAKNTIGYMEMGEMPMDIKEHARLEKLVDTLGDVLSSIIGTCRDGKIAYLSGSQIGLAKEAVMMAAEIRGA